MSAPPDGISSEVWARRNEFRTKSDPKSPGGWHVVIDRFTTGYVIEERDTADMVSTKNLENMLRHLGPKTWIVGAWTYGIFFGDYLASSERVAEIHLARITKA